MFTMVLFTFREAFSRKILLVSAVLALVFLGLYLTGVHFAVRDIAKSNNAMLASMLYPQLLLFGLYFGSFIVSFLAIISSAGLISSEIESGNIQSIIPKPIRRYQIVAGKFLGQGIFLTCYAALMFGAIASIIYFKTGIALPGIWRAGLLFMLQPVVLMALTIFVSTLTTTVASGATAFMFYAVAVVGGIIEQIASILGNTTLKSWGIVASLIMPVDSLYRKIVHIMLPPSNNPFSALQQMGPFGSTVEPSVWAVVYSVIYVFAFFGLSIYYFGRKDI
ncbi:MAG: ABC transporter permease [Desulfocucumaceae bacterium]